MRVTTTLLLLLLCTGLTTSAEAQTADQTVSIVVPTVNDLTLSASGAIINVAFAPGSAVATGSNSGTTYSVVTNSGDNMRITGELLNDYVSGVTLKVNLGVPSPSGDFSNAGTSLGEQVLSVAAIDLVQNMNSVSGTGTVTYSAEVAANVDAGADHMRTVRYTLTSM